MSSTLTIQQVSRMIGRSTKSIRNYIKEGRLTAEKVSSPRGLEFRFDFGTVSTFAKKHLDISIEQNISSAPKQDRSASRGSNGSSGLGDVTKLLTQLEKEKSELLKELGDMKAQAGYKIGQLESRLKLLETTQAERDALKRQYDALASDYRTKEREAQELLKAKNYYDARRWWHIWKGRYRSSTEPQEPNT